MKIVVVRMKRAQFTLLIGVVTAIGNYAGHVILDPSLSALVGAVIVAVVAYLATEEKDAPNGGETKT